MNTIVRILSFTLLTTYAGLLWAQSQTPTAGDAPVAKVNGKAISTQDYEHYLKVRQEQARRNGDAGILEFDTVIDEMITQELIIADAQDKKLDQMPEFQARLEDIKRGLLMEFAAVNYMKTHQPSEAALRAEYDRMIKETDNREYYAHHILVKTQEKTDEVLQKLKAGGDFSELAKEYSTDTATAVVGGDLGWFPRQRMVQPFGDAVSTMEKGTYTESPVETDYGWHIIFLKDVREAKARSFEEVKPKLHEKIQHEQGGAYVAELKKKANIEIFHGQQKQEKAAE